MYFSSWQQVLHMDGHGIYVWPAYIIGITFWIILALVLRARSRYLLRKLQRQVEHLHQAKESDHVKQSDIGVQRAPIT
jgi:heme exporter protein D